MSLSVIAIVIGIYLTIFAHTTRSQLAAKPYPRDLASSGIYNSSTTPSSLPWNTYNYCNAPHVNPAHYSLPENDTTAKLVYLNVVMRHHKRTPDNLYPSENSLNPSTGWDCHDFIQQIYAKGAAQISRQTVIPAWHPFLSEIWNGTCDSGQLTRQGLEDSIRHGTDFWGVYHHHLGLLSHVNTNEILIRTSTSLRTQHVASGFLYGMDRATAKTSFPVYAQPSNIDSIVPNYVCPRADNIRQAYQSVPEWTDHLQKNADLMQRLGETLGTTGLGSWESSYDHYFDTLNSRTCHGHPLPCNATGSCVSQEDAARVASLGDFEYDYIYNAAQNSSTYVQLTFGVFFLELAQNFQLFKSGGETHKLRFYIGHDGSMIRLAAGLGFGKVAPLRWPAIGSEIVMEVWRTKTRDFFVRVLHEGTTFSNLAWVPLDEFIGLLNSQSQDVYSACMST